MPVYLITFNICVQPENVNIDSHFNVKAKKRSLMFKVQIHFKFLK